MSEALSPRPDPAPSPWLADTMIEGRFQVVRELGRGGMGAVYVVFDREVCRELALKRIHPQGVGQQDHEERFRREYRALASIHDPGVPQVHHSGRTADGVAWFTMEAIRGESLRAILQRDTLGPARALDLAIKLGKILAVAHEAGVIHRDVKPANIMVEPGDRVRLLDFGVCTPLRRFLRAAEPRRRTAHVDRWHSGEDNFAGTIGYSDPVTYDGSPATLRSDIYSLAVILYELLTGRRHCDPDSMVYRTIDDAEFHPALAPLAHDLRRAVSHETLERPRTMAEFVQRLEIARRILARAEAKASPAPRPTLPPLLLGLALGITAAALAVFAREALKPAPHASTTTAPPTVLEAASTLAADSPPVPAEPLTTPAVPADTHPADPADPADPGLEASDFPSSPLPADTWPTPSGTAENAADARRKLARLTPRIAGCVDSFGPAPGPDLPVTLVLERGRVRAVAPVPGNPLLTTCVAATLLKLSFAPGTPTPLTYSFRLP